jgi:uncharacterized membrane protein
MIMLALAIALHVIAAVVWIGGMFFAYVCLRPVAGSLLDPQQFLPLIAGVLHRFFAWVWAAALILPVTGVWLAWQRFGGMGDWPAYIHVMFGLGLLMILLFLHVYFAPYRRLRDALNRNDVPEAGRQLGRIRPLFAVNLVLGIIVVLIASGGRYLA